MEIFIYYHVFFGVITSTKDISQIVLLIKCQLTMFLQTVKLKNLFSLKIIVFFYSSAAAEDLLNIWQSFYIFAYLTSHFSHFYNFCANSWWCHTKCQLSTDNPLIFLINWKLGRVVLKGEAFLWLGSVRTSVRNGELFSLI